eukprot:2559184-Amphidinium_carterae.1
MSRLSWPCLWMLVHLTVCDAEAGAAVQHAQKESPDDYWQHLNLMWLLSPHSVWLPNGAVRTAVRHRLGLSLLHADHRCKRYVCQRHNALRNCWGSLARQAGWHASIEQTVPLAVDSTSDRITKQCDLVLSAPGGARCRPHPHALQRTASAKYAQYRVSAGGSLPFGEQFLALHGDAIRLAERLLSDLAQRFILQGDCAGGAVYRAHGIVYSTLSAT